MHDVITIGSTTLDSFRRTNFDSINYEKTTSGRALVVPLGEKFATEDVVFSLGGNAANASITFSRSKLKTSVFTKIGDDSNGEYIKKYLKKEKVSIKNIETSKDKYTANSVILLQNGERSILTYHGALNEFSVDEINLNKIKAKWWYVSLPGESYKSFDRLLDYAEKNGIKVALNPSSGHLSGEGKKYLLDNIKKISVLIVNEGEASKLTDIPFEKKEEVFKKLDEIVPGIVVITDGPNGAYVSDGVNIYKSGVFKEKEVKDRTGAGDAFGSGFVLGLINRKEECKKGYCDGGNIKYAIRLASANATSVVEHVGTTDGIINIDEFNKNERWSDSNIEITKIK